MSLVMLLATEPFMNYVFFFLAVELGAHFSVMFACLWKSNQALSSFTCSFLLLIQAFHPIQ